LRPDTLHQLASEQLLFELPLEAMQLKHICRFLMRGDVEPKTKQALVRRSPGFSQFERGNQFGLIHATAYLEAKHRLSVTLMYPDASDIARRVHRRVELASVNKEDPHTLPYHLSSLQPRKRG